MKMTYSRIIYAWLIFGSGILCDSKLESRQTPSSCKQDGGDKYCCSNNLQVIDWSLVCNGYKHCLDGSDENNNMCSHYDLDSNMTMDCGRVHIKDLVTFEKGNKEEKVVIAPWYVTILKSINSKYQKVCGGSIVAPNIVISVARCFWEEGMKPENISINYNLYRICVGKYDENYTDNNHECTQIMKVKKIYLEKRYKGEGYIKDNTVLNNADIAVIVLANKIAYSNDVLPVCIDWSGVYNTVNGNELEGVIIRNTTELSNSEKKKSSYIDNNACPVVYPIIFSKVEPNDTFCAKRQPESWYDTFGNPGTGISYLYNNSYYYLIGINSSIPGIETNKNQVDVFTEIKHYITWIRGIMNQHVIQNTCVLPTVEGVVYSSATSNEILSHGTLVDHNHIVNEGCEVGYHNADPFRFRICQEKGKWKSNPNKLCFKMCPPLESNSLDIKCSYNGKDANCSNLSIPDTIAKPSCKTAYKAQDGEENTPKELTCQPDGTWSRQLYSCIPECGKEYIGSKPLVLYGVPALIGSAPWNIALYKLNESLSNYQLICGGSIISPNLVVTAAHCFEDEYKKSWNISINDDKYKIAVGKYYRNFSIIKNDFTKILNVKTVYFKKEYRGYYLSYADDIAILVLKDRVSFNKFVAPICIDWTSKYKEVVNGEHGKIVGWGYTENCSVSDILLEASLPYINFSSCWSRYENTSFKSFVTKDKFCAGSKSVLEQGVDSGDSGAGLSYLHSGLYYLTGVTSVKETEKKTSVAVFTDVKHHIQWMKDLYDEYNLD